MTKEKEEKIRLALRWLESVKIAEAQLIEAWTKYLQLKKEIGEMEQ